MLDQRLRAEVEQKLRPLGARLRRSGFTADQITVLGLAASVYTAVAIATGHFFLAAVGVAASGLTDVLDGAVAKADGTAGPRGAFFDSVSDRVSDAVGLGGAAWYLAGGPDPRLAVLA
ncbi:MAG: CDP-alcohol phosphatidyltransferase family protein, partial [Acidimicrobiia bacterium]